MTAKKTIRFTEITLLIILFSLFWTGNAYMFPGAFAEADGEIQRHDPDSAKNPGPPATQEKEKKIKYWVAPMDPNYIRDKPGKSPMGMDLIPVYEDDEGTSEKGVIKIDPVTVQNFGVRTSVVSKGKMGSTIRTIGNITYDEEKVEHIHTKISGWVEKLFVNTTGEKVEKGQKLLSLYSPDLVSTQEEYLQALRYKEKVSASTFPDVVKSADTLIEASRKRLLLMDIDIGQINAIAERGEVQKTLDLHSHVTGIVVKKNVLEGMKLDPGMELYMIADISRVWVIASIYEYELPFIKVGQDAEMSLPYEPGSIYHGRITFIYPYLSSKTRTVQVRIEFENPGLKLKPDMYADVMISSKISRKTLLVPSEAVIRTGSRNVVVTSLGGGKFLPKEITTGSEGEGFVQVLSGLDEGDTVVTSGQFLIDSESNLREAINKMLEVQQQSPADESQQPSAHKPAETGMQEMKPGEEAAADKGQSGLMMKLIDSYLKIHDALVAESPSDAAAETQAMANVIEEVKSSGEEVALKDDIALIEESLKGLLSGDLGKARSSFKSMSRGLIAFVKGPAREEAVSSGIKLYYCPMEKERWLQKGPELKNPYLGKDMLICGSEEKY